MTQNFYVCFTSTSFYFYFLPFSLLHAFLSSPHPHLWQPSVSSLYLWAYFPVLSFFFFFKIPHVMEITQYLPFFVWLILVSIRPWGASTLSRGDIHTSVFTEVTYTTAKLWKSSKCPSTDEWTKRMIREGPFPRVTGMAKHRKFNNWKMRPTAVYRTCILIYNHPLSFIICQWRKIGLKRRHRGNKLAL